MEDHLREPGIEAVVDRDLDQGLGIEKPVPDDPHSTRLFRDEDVAVGQEREA